MSVREWCAEIDEEMILADGFDEAFVGYATRCGMPAVAVYDVYKCLGILTERHGLSAEEAIEHFEFNIAGAYVGEHTPMFITRRPE